MTPTAPSSSILLLNPANQSGTTAAGADAQATPGAGLSGFELLLGAMQQLQQELSATIADNNAEGDAPHSDGKPGGNALPQLGTLLPSLPLSGKAANNAGDVLSTDDGAGEKDSKSKEADDASADFLLFNPVQSPIANSTTPIANDAQNSIGSMQTPISDIAAADELASQIAATGAGVASKDSSNGKTNRNDTVSLKLGLTELNRASDTGSANNIDTSMLAQKAPGAAPAESDFDSLIKHFETPSSPQITGAPVGAGESSLVNHASRTYSSAMNSNATVPVPVGSEGWGDAIADKVMWFSANKVSSAEIHLNPPDLGPLQVRVSTQQDQASVVFTSQHAAVRDALDQALPRLRDMMGSQGMQLLDVSVGGQNAQQQQQQFARNDSSQSGGQFAGFIADDAADTKNANVTAINTARLLRSGVDAYA